MELGHVEGGIGEIVWKGKLPLMQRLFEITENTDGVRCAGHKPDVMAEFELLMEELFPEFPLTKVCEAYQVIRRKGRYGGRMGEVDEIDIGGRGIRLNGAFPSPTELMVTKPNGGQKSWMAVILERYSMNVVDDVVNNHDRRFSVQPFMGRGRDFSIPNPLGLETAISLYKRAKKIVDDCENVVGLTREDLDVLRKDQYHENAFVRQGTVRMYEDAVSKLSFRLGIVAGP